MHKETPTTEAIKKPEVQENLEAPRSVESPEEIQAKMTSEAEKETVQFEKECAEDLSRAETRAEKDGLSLDSNDKKELQGLSQEADRAKVELLNEITPPPLPDKRYLTPPPLPNIPPPLPKEYVQKYSATPPPLPNMPPPIPKEHLRPVPPPIPEWANKIEMIKPEEIIKKESAMKERATESPDLLSKKEASKKFLAEERKKLAEEIRAERKAQRDRLSTLKNATENATVSTENMESGQEDNQYGRISKLQTAEANELAERISSSELSEQDAQDERENISQLVANSENIKSLKAKLEEHYAKADEISKERFETLNRSLENVMKRNNAFIVHVLAESEEARHNANSNVSGEATYEDDIDIMLSLEPSVSASSIVSGKRISLWPGQTGFLLGGGQIGEAGHGDLGTHGDKIKKRTSAGGKYASIEKIDEVVGRENGQHTGMNEVVVNNAEIFGFFQKAGKDENGKIWMYSLDTKKNSKKTNQLNLARYKERFSLSNKRGMPSYVMTEDMNVYEYLGVNDDGSVEVGKQLTPEEVATGRAGLPPEKRKEIGERLLEKKIFKKQETHKEAHEIIDRL